MYHPKVIEQACEKFEARYRRRLIRYSVAQVDEWQERLPKMRVDGKGLTRGVTKEEQDFITNEQVLTQFDFLYWASRYAYFVQDPVMGGGLNRYVPWESQDVAMKTLQRLQLDQWERAERGETTDGIRVVMHKGRQQGMTEMGVLLMVHRLTRRMHQRGLSASIDDDKIQELYDRHKTVYDHLAPYLKPALKYDVKSQDLQMEDTESQMLYQIATQKGGIGQGRQRDIAQFTELASWDSVAGWDTTRVQLELQFAPTLPQSVWTLFFGESTSLVRGDWFHDFCDRLRRDRKPGWTYQFIPYYAMQKKYTRTPPVGWEPSELAMRHARRVHETSGEFLGRSVMLNREQLYWYESEYEAAREAHALNLFLTNYCATPEESFQHATRSAFDTELLDFFRKHTVQPGMYDLEFDKVA
jgi:hypothetical protein